MVNLKLNIYLKALAVGVLALQLAACGGSKSNDTIPTYETIGYSHNLVFRNNTALMSVGYNAYGQLGTDNLDNRSVAGFIVDYHSFRSAAIGANYSVAIDTDGKVWSWGYNAYGQLGDKSYNYSKKPVFSNITASMVAVGAHHTLALRKNDNSLWVWGRNNYGQLGENLSTSNYTSPQPAKIALTNISSIVANGYNSLARANGQIWAWGYNSSGQVGADPAKVPYVPYSSASTGAVRVKLLTFAKPIAEVVAGGATTYALTRSGEVYALGNNYNGQLGNGSITDEYSYSPVQVKTAAGPVLSNVIKVSAGKQHCLALLADGTVWAWGYNFYGQLGNNEPSDSRTAVQVKDTLGTGYLAGVNDIKAFGSSSMAKIGNTWYAWGDNEFGQLGVNLSGSRKLPTPMAGF